MPELMKGHVYTDRKHTVKYPCIAEVKYDEIRVHVKYDRTRGGSAGHSVQFLSYAGKPLANLGMYSHIFLQFFRESGLTELDMGFEVNGNFNDSYRWVRSTKKLPDELVGATIKWFLFDIPECKLPFDTDSDPNDLEDRRAVRRLHAYNLRELGLPVLQPAGLSITTEAGLNRYFELVREDGFEGLMVKSRDHLYLKGKRTDGWLKMKPEAEEDGEIVGFTEAISESGVPLGRAGSVTLRIPEVDKEGIVNRYSFASPHGIVHDLGADMWQNPTKYLGQWAMFHYMERDRQGGYRHPTWGRLREAKA